MGRGVANLSQQLKALGAQLVRLAGEVSRRDASEGTSTAFAGFDKPKVAWLNAAKLARDGRACRHDYFPSEFFGEPAWNILLELFICELQGRYMSVQDACLASGVPPTTALRYVGNLQERHLLRRMADKTDGRRTYVRITNRGDDLMRQYLAHIIPDLATLRDAAGFENALIDLDDNPNPT